MAYRKISSRDNCHTLLLVLQLQKKRQQNNYWTREVIGRVNPKRREVPSCDKRLPRREIQLMAKIIDGFPKIILSKIPEIIMLMIPNAGIIKM